MSEVTVMRSAPQGMVTLKGDLAEMGTAVQAVTGAVIPSQRKIAGGVAWMAPDEVMILCNDATSVVADLSKRLAGKHFMAVDMSDARAMFTLEGAGLRDVLGKVTPADLGMLDPGEMRRTRLAQVAGALWFETPTRAHVICFRSVADYVHRLLEVSARSDAQVGFHFIEGAG